MSDHAYLLAVPGVGEVEVSRHARDRMIQRNVSVQEIEERLLSDPRKLLAVQRIVGDAQMSVTIGRLTMALAMVGPRLRILSVWWRGCPDPGL